MVARVKAGPAVSDPSVLAYLMLTREIWADVQPLIGSVTLSTLLNSAIRHAAKEHRFLDKLEVSLSGLGEEAERVLAKAPPAEAQKALALVVRNLMCLFESVAGPILLKKVIPKVIRIEKAVAQAGTAP